MNAGEFCIRDVIIATRELSVVEGAARMASHHVGDLIVVEPRATINVPIGIVTDRDLVRFALGGGLEAVQNTPLGDIMSPALVTAREHEDVGTVLHTMCTHGVRRMPVVNERGGLEGIITADDLIEWLAGMMQELSGLIRREQSREREAVETRGRTTSPPAL